MNQECSKCGGRIVVDSYKGEAFCFKCGEVVEDAIATQEPEFTEDGKKKGYGPVSKNTDIHSLGGGLSRAEINKLPPKIRKKYIRLIRWSYNTIKAIDKNLNFAFGEIDKYVSYLKLPNYVKEHAAGIYKSAVHRNLIKGRNIECVAAGALYAACKISDNPRTLEEVASASGTGKKELGRTYRYISRELELGMALVDPVSYVFRFAGQLKLSVKTQTTAVKILESAKKEEILSGKSPQGTAASALYVASIINKEKVTQRAVADAAGVTEVTIRNRYKEFVRELDLREQVRRKR